MSVFASADEFREVVNIVLTRVRDEPELRGRFGARGVRQRLVVGDLDVVVDVETSTEGDISWTCAGWGEGWEPNMSLRMDSDVANGYFQGAENVAIAIARGRIHATVGDVRALLNWVPATRAVFDAYRETVAADYPHLSLTPAA